MRGMPPIRSGASRSGARGAQGAVHAQGPGGGAFGTSSADSHLGKAIASGHQEKVYGDPASKNRLVGYGGQAPRYRKKKLNIVTVLIILLFLVILVSQLSPQW